MAGIFSAELGCWKILLSVLVWFFLLSFFKGINFQISCIFSVGRFVIVYFIFNKGLREETEHRPRQDS